MVRFWRWIGVPFLALMAVVLWVSVPGASAGDPEPMTSFGPVFVSRSVIDYPNASGSAKVVTGKAHCPSGYLASGGGARQLLDGAPIFDGGALFNTAPVGNPPTGWTASGYNGVGYGSVFANQLEVFAVCQRTPGVSGGLDGHQIVWQPSATQPGTLGPIQVVAICPGGKKVTGGGRWFTSDGLEASRVIMSVPFDEGGKSGWLVKAASNTVREPWRILAYAVCANG